MSMEIDISKDYLLSEDVYGWLMGYLTRNNIKHREFNHVYRDRSEEVRVGILFTSSAQYTSFIWRANGRFSYFEFI